PEEEEHLAAARKNKVLAQLILEQEDPSWAAVLAFYSALHLVDAYLARQDIHPRSHEARQGCVARVSALRPLHHAYRKLETRSRWVRYDLRPLPSFEVEHLITEDLARIEQVLGS